MLNPTQSNNYMSKKSQVLASFIFNLQGISFYYYYFLQIQLDFDY